MSTDPFRVALAQYAPSYLDRDATITKVVRAIGEAAQSGARLVAFGEAFVPGYPVWLSRTGGAKFDDPAQRAIHARYIDQSVTIEAGHLGDVQRACAQGNIWCVLGVIERPRDRGHSLYCSCVTIDSAGEIRSVHRKLMPTYEERLAWSVGDANGLVAHDLEPFTLGSLNCWENWMPMARAALYAQGVDLHVAIWPGGVVNTQDITRFIARESRSYVLSVGALFRKSDIPDDVTELDPVRDLLLADDSDVFHDGGSAIASPDGTWLIEPVALTEGLLYADLDPKIVREHRQNFDPAGHYARPDVLQLSVDRTRQTTARFSDNP